MQKNNVRNSVIILAILIVLSFGFFVTAQEKNSAGNIFLDSDQDGLSDAEEKTYGTNPQKADTDGDGYSDGVEVKGGYDPLKPAPGDKLINQAEKVTPSKNKTEETKKITGNNAKKDANLTENFSSKIAAAASSSDPNKQTITIDELQKMADESLNSATTVEQDLPEVKIEDIKIKKQNYSKLSETERKSKLKEDATSYLIGLLYVFSSNSPYKITSTFSLSSLVDLFVGDLNNSLYSGSSEKLKEIATFGETVSAKMKEMEVPEDLSEIHMKGLRFALYAITLKDSLDTNYTDDPLASMAQLSKMTGFLEIFSPFFEEVNQKFEEYGITYDENLEKRMTEAGIDSTFINVLKNTVLSNSEINLDTIESSPSKDSSEKDE